MYRDIDIIGRQRGARPTVLVIEDETLIALDTAETAVELGFQVIGKAQTITQALAFLAGEVPDLVVLDLHLEQEGDGEELLPRLLARGCDCIVLSADEQACARVALAFPNIPVLTKPASPGRLKQELARLVFRRMPTGGGRRALGRAEAREPGAPTLFSS